MAETVWLVDRTYSDKGLVNLVYATVDGERYLRRQLSEQMLTRTDVTAGMDVEVDRLEPVQDEDERERFAAEARRMTEEHDPGDAV
jgi:hypothetical protein